MTDENDETKKANIHADNKSVAVGSIAVAGSTGDINIHAGDIGYSVEDVSVLISQIKTTFQPKPFDGRCPYKGLDVFKEEDTELFFGREKLVEELLTRVKGSLTVFITGPSGSGKSSLVRAGLIPALKQGAIKNLHSEHWLYETLKPGREPMVELGRVVASITGTLNAGEDIRTKGLMDATILAQWCEIALKDDREKRAVLFIDQFEEIFTQMDKEAERLSFLNLLTHAATVENGRVILLFAMRSDFLPNCASYPELNALLSQQFIQIGAMRPKELVSAIAQPALRVGLQIDPDLVTQIINDMEAAPGALPLMQFALKDLFDSQQGKGGLIALTLYDYNERGGIHEALERHADASFAKLNQHEQQLARSIFSGLIAVGHGTQDTRRTAPFNELVPANANAQDVGTVVQKLADARLITTEEGDNSKYTITHEKLISSWTWLEKLINDNRDAIDLQNEIANDAKEWEDHQRDPSYLYTGARLASAREKLDANKIVLSGLAQLFVETGVKAYADELEAAQQRTTQLRRRSVYLTTALFAALFAVGIAVFFSVQSQRQAKISSARELAATSITTLDLDPDLSLRLALQSLSDMRTSQGEDALRRALSSPSVELTLLGHSGAVYSVAYDHDGKRLVTASQDGTTRIWDAATGQELLVLRGHVAAVNCAAFSPDGELVATAGADKTVRIWDAKTGQQLRSIDKHSAAVNSVAFNSNGQYIVTASDDKTSRVWQVVDGSQVRVLDQDVFDVCCAVFSPNGKLIATAAYDQINVWDAATGQLTSSLQTEGENVATIAFSADSQYLLADLLYNAYRWDIASGTQVTQYSEGHTWYVTSVAFNPLGGSQVATASADQTVRIWDTELGNEIEIVRGQSGAIYSIAFDPTGDHLAAASEDQTVRIWNLGEWRKRVLIEPSGRFIDAAYSSDGSKITTAGSDGMIRIWEAATGRELNAWVYPYWFPNHLHFSPDDQQIITSSDDATWRLWDAATGEELYQYQYLDSSTSLLWVVSDARFNHDGTRIITTGRDGLAIIWDAKTKQQLVQLKGTKDGLWTGMFSPDGKLAVTASADRTARIWDVQTGKQLHVLAGHSDLVTSAAFSADGKRIVTTSVDSTARLWDTDTGHLRLILKGHTREVTDAVFSPTDPYVATSSRDHTVILWNADTGDEIVQLFGHSKDIAHLVFSPDGKSLLTAGLDGTARIYPVHYEDLLALAHSLLSPRELTCAEHVKYLHEKLICPTPTSILAPTP